MTLDLSKALMAEISSVPLKSSLHPDPGRKSNFGISSQLGFLCKARIAETIGSRWLTMIAQEFSGIFESVSWIVAMIRVDIFSNGSTSVSWR